MYQQSLNQVEQLVKLEVSKQLAHLPRAFRKYQSYLNQSDVMARALKSLPHNVRYPTRTGNQQVQLLRVKVAVQQAISSIIQDDLKFYYPFADLEDDEDSPTEPITEYPIRTS
ncbi:MAG: hypothetical protein N5P05_003612 [Chroococcopsis gigantea SAG 12.99]|jgi:hypothetical protein|nr:hypothetical protein [Chroococcopsis gigantea SAG 12.99]